LAQAAGIRGDGLRETLFSTGAGASVAETVDGFSSGSVDEGAGNPRKNSRSLPPGRVCCDFS